MLNHSQALNALHLMWKPAPEPGWVLWGLVVSKIKTSLSAYIQWENLSLGEGGKSLESFQSVSVFLTGRSPFNLFIYF